jgi:anaerobic selenocysteine-containing dehydrogenase
VIFWGSNPLSTNHHIWKFAKGAHKVVVDPVTTRTARAADEHLALKPGTDAALALGLTAEIVRLGGHDKRFLAERAVGWPEYEERLADWSAERAAAICDLPAERITALAQRIAGDRPTAIRCSMGMQRHAGGGAAVRAVAALPVVTGDWGRPGGGFLYSTDYFRPNTFAMNRPDLRPGKVRRFAQTHLAETLLTVDDPPVTALFVYCANPAASNPDSVRVRDALCRDDLFTVVVDHFQTDTADYADIVLPSTMQIEQLDVNDGYGHGYLHLNRPAVEPAGECLPHTEIFRRIAAAMGLDEPALYASDEELVDTLLDGFGGRDELERQGWARIEPPASDRPYELWSEHAAKDGLDPLPGYVSNAEGDDGLVLIAGASHWFVNTNFANRERHRGQAGEPTVLLHPDDAAARGLTDGERVRICNRRGSYEALLAVGDATRRGVAATTKGWWPKLTRDGNANETTVAADADMAEAAVFHDNAVTIEPL